MKLSDKKSSEIYSAIRDPIMDARIKLKLSEEQDYILFKLETEIWKNIKNVLKIEGKY